MYLRKILIGILILGIFGGCYFIYNITQTIFKPITAFNNEEAYIYIPSDADFEYVKEELEPLLTDMDAFSTLAKKLGYTKRIKGGKYIIRKGMNSNELVKTLLNRSVYVRVIIPENKTHRELAKIISDQIEATESDVYKIFTETINMEDVKVYNMSFESFLIPGTYKMPWSTSAIAFRDFMIKNNQNQNQQ
ncbi:endolytic transglycosylase MltG [Kordia sp.]|uniref:endolytic transglycosylase MltG n=1 Tax=Kordia sp. TaxID=1965332 RepID=UPI003D6C69B5